MNINSKSGNEGPDIINASEVNEMSTIRSVKKESLVDYELNSFQWNLWQTVSLKS
jgi:hypothetical protein